MANYVSSLHKKTKLNPVLKKCILNAGNLDDEVHNFG